MDYSWNHIDARAKNPRQQILMLRWERNTFSNHNSMGGNFELVLLTYTQILCLKYLLLNKITVKSVNMSKEFHLYCELLASWE